MVVSSDLRELMQVCDRIGVMRAGRLTQIFRRDSWSRDALLAAAFGECPPPSSTSAPETADAF